MARGVFLHFLCVLGTFPEGVTAVIQTQDTVLAAVGDDASLNCLLVQSKDVLQVTWQKILPEGEKNLATNNKYFGQRVNPDFRDKVEFRDAVLQNSSIVIRKVTEQDEGCYRCLFNAYPEGALTGTTCLQLYELHEPVLNVVSSNCSQESVTSCSATGRPAPTVTLTVTQPHLHLSNSSSVRVVNTNGTVTVTTTAVLSGSRVNAAQVGCAARALSARQIEVFVRIPDVTQMRADGLLKESGSDHGELNLTWIVVAVVVAVTCVAAVIAVLFQQKNNNRDPEKTTAAETSGRDVEGVRTPLMKQWEPIRTKSSAKKRSPEQKPPKSAAFKGRRLFDERC